MIKIDLVTGFLGAGKTTFIKKYAKFLLDSGEKICIIENDYGAVNVDMVLLKDLLSDDCNLEMIIGGDGREAHQRRFKTKLISMGMSGYTRVIIEPSGIYDVDEFFDVLYDEPLDRWYETGSVISIIDASNYQELTDLSRYILMSESSWAGKVVISKSRDESDLEKVRLFLNSTMEEFGCNTRFEEKDFVLGKLNKISLEDLRSIRDSGYRHAAYTKLPVSDKEFTSLFYFDVEMDIETLQTKIEQLFSDGEAGHVIRIKGSVKVAQNAQVEVNATENGVQIKPAACTRDILIVIGEKLNKTYINKKFENYCSVLSL